jgi:hypothetical protein
LVRGVTPLLRKLEGPCIAPAVVSMEHQATSRKKAKGISKNTVLPVRVSTSVRGLRLEVVIEKNGARARSKRSRSTAELETLIRDPDQDRARSPSIDSNELSF